MKKGFTIIELMAVVATLGNLMGIVVSAAANSVRLTRSQKASALCAVVQQGVETYYAQKDKWPGSIGDRIENGSTLSRTNNEGVDNQTEYDRYILDGSEVRDMVKSVVEECVKNNNPLMDISGLFVSRDPGESGGHGAGYNFWEAVRGSERTKKKMTIGEMYYGYPETDHGWFRRFKITYVNGANTMEVGKQ